MVRIEVSHPFPVSVDEAFAYITDMKNWPEYWPDFTKYASTHNLVTNFAMMWPLSHFIAHGADLRDSEAKADLYP